MNTKTKDPKLTVEIDAKVQKEVRRIRRDFDRTVHQMLTEYLEERDAGTNMTNRDTIIAAGHKGWGISVGISLQEPHIETEVEAKANPSGIEIVKA